MSTQSVYAYTDLDRNTVMVDDGDIHFTGTWSSSGTYESSTKDTVRYGSGQFITLVDNIGVVPTQVPRRGQSPRWSSLVVIKQGTDTGNHTADEAYALASDALSVANGAFSIAVSGTNAISSALSLANQARVDSSAALATAWSGTAGVGQVLPIAIAGTNAAATALAAASTALSSAQAAAAASDVALTTAWSGTAGVGQVLPIAIAGTNTAIAALNTAWSGTAGAGQAFQVAVAGTNAASQANALAYTALQTAWTGTTSYSERGWSGTIQVDLTGPTYQRMTIHGTTIIQVVNPSAVRGVTAILVSDTVSDAALSFTPGITWFGLDAPTELTGGKRMIVNFTSFGSVASEIHAAYTQQA